MGRTQARRAFSIRDDGRPGVICAAAGGSRDSSVRDFHVRYRLRAGQKRKSETGTDGARRSGPPDDRRDRYSEPLLRLMAAFSHFMTGDFHHFRYRYELKSLVFVLPDQMVGRDDRLRTIGAHRAMAAIVKKDHIATASMKLARDLLCDHRGRRSLPVIAGHTPHHGVEPQFTGDAQRCRTPSTKWRTEQARMLADGVSQG